MVAEQGVVAEWVWGAGVLGSLLVLVSLVIAWTACGGGAARLGWTRGRLNAGAGAWGILAVLALSHGVEAGLRSFGLGPSPALEQLGPGLYRLPVEQIALVGFALGVVAPVGEELFFRGVLQRGLAGPLGRRGAWLTASALFGAAHGEAALGVGAFVLGMVLGWIFDRTGSLWLPLGAHALNNGVAVGEAWLVGPETVGVPWIAALVGTSGGLWALRRMARALEGYPAAV